jgi:hypothetical protein
MSTIVVGYLLMSAWPTIDVNAVVKPATTMFWALVGGAAYCSSVLLISSDMIVTTTYL